MALMKPLRYDWANRYPVLQARGRGTMDSSELLLVLSAGHCTVPHGDKGWCM